jgi:putative ubiquitin-RnfH superfamily antitoxin RatB of RatAB toxin-antitoxin module
VTLLRACVALALPDRQEVVAVELDEGATVADALNAAQAERFFAGIGLAELAFGIWGKACAMETRLRDGDRVEVYRPLQADPKAMRRARAGVRTSTRSRSGP